METVDLEEVSDQDDIEELRSLIQDHEKNTGSNVANHILKNWNKTLKEFVKVMPTDYKRVLEERKQAEKELVA